MVIEKGKRYRNNNNDNKVVVKELNTSQVTYEVVGSGQKIKVSKRHFMSTFREDNNG